ncbi:hypothetical protein QRN89_10075 [Streptomyces chengbuensis]|uniref:hypothetical protein n=1 Tax=Streptomyces chengbuensis TaxID=3053466 RepID=UPI0025B59B8E|nr:hypothetical protein [Streptomyces sp. HUAS CB01]WJY50138.1 hypothetical protein QRN89_10075 [Streptomyces sp. HUAS CB01]
MSSKSARGNSSPNAAGQAKKPTGHIRRKEKREFAADMKLRTLRPEELLHPAQLLARFTERAAELIAQLPQDARPTPATVNAALRQGVLEAFRTRDEHIARLVETDVLASTPEQGAKAIRRAVRASLIDMGVRVVEEADEQELFVVVEGEGEGFELVRPAYVDQATDKLLLAGQLRRIPTRRTLPGRDGASAVDVRGDDAK